MSARCPEGHLSESLDYCDTCGSPMGAAGGGASGGGAAAARESALQLRSDEHGAMAQEPPDRDRRTEPDAQVCPFCSAPNVSDALFCEACGYDFTTGTPPMGSEPVAEEPEGLDEAEAAEEADESEDRAGEGEPVEDETDDGADPTGSSEEPGVEPDEGPDPGPEAEPTSEPDEPDPADPDAVAPDPADPEPADPEPDAPEPADPEPEPAAPPIPAAPTPATEDRPEAPLQRRARHTPPSRALAQAWVVELWVDPDWYAVQQTAEDIPSPGVPDVVLLTRNSALVGRPSGSLGARPEVDAGIDSAVSRRHAQLTSDGRRWWIEDLGSSNGTFVGTFGEPLPSTPITPGQRVELDRDDRVYLGAWTRLVLRPATDSEQTGTG